MFLRGTGLYTSIILTHSTREPQAPRRISAATTVDPLVGKILGLPTPVRLMK